METHRYFSTKEAETTGLCHSEHSEVPQYCAIPQKCGESQSNKLLYFFIYLLFKTNTLIEQHYLFHPLNSGN